MDKTKYWTNYFLIFSLIMLAQLIYAVSHLLNQYYGVPNDNGFGVKQDHNAAFEWFKRVIRVTFLGTNWAISRGYFKGLGVKQDYAKAIEWAQKGAAQDHAVSQLLLALYYSDDKTGFKDLDKSKNGQKLLAETAMMMLVNLFYQHFELVRSYHLHSVEIN